MYFEKNALQELVIYFYFFLHLPYYLYFLLLSQIISPKLYDAGPKN